MRAPEDELADVAEAMRADPRGVMWQLCGAAETGALDVSAVPRAVAFAPRRYRDSLPGAPRGVRWLRADGGPAGLLRLVPLRPGLPDPRWTDTDEGIRRMTEELSFRRLDGAQVTTKAQPGPDLAAPASLTMRQLTLSDGTVLYQLRGRTAGPATTGWTTRRSPGCGCTGSRSWRAGIRRS